MKLVLVASTPWSIIPFRGKLISGMCDRGIEVHICAPFTKGDNGIVQDLRNKYNVQSFASFREGDVRHSQADISKARRLLGYQPKFDLRQGIKETMPWYCHNCG